MNVDEFVKGHIYNKRAWTTFFFSDVINLKVLVFNLYILKSSMFKSQVPVLLLHEIMGTKCLCYSCMGLWVPSVCVTPAWDYGYHAKTDHSSGQIASLIRQNANFKTGVSRKQSTSNYPKQWTFLTPWYTQGISCLITNDGKVWVKTSCEYFLSNVKYVD